MSSISSLFRNSPSVSPTASDAESDSAPFYSPTASRPATPHQTYNSNYSFLVAVHQESLESIKDLINKGLDQNYLSDKGYNILVRGIIF